MDNYELSSILWRGVNVWNKWREDNPDVLPQLSEEYLFEQNLVAANLSGADLSRAYLVQANLICADLSGANLSEANLSGANLDGADLRGANLSGANLSRANLSRTILIGADLSGADLTNSNMVETFLCGTDLTGSCIYGISVWNVRTDEDTKQNNLIITKADESTITIDNLEVAQFIYLILNNQKIKDVINTIGKNAVLILGNFGSRLNILNTIKFRLRELGFLPILFDFEKPDGKDTAETILTLAGLCRFVIADLTEPRSIPLELKTIVSNLPTLPVQLLLHNRASTFGMVDHILNFNSISGVSRYDDIDDLTNKFTDLVIKPVEEWKCQNKGKIEAKLLELSN